MPLKFMYITNDVEVAKIAEDNGVEWIFIDLEINGKEDRQGHLDTVISRHSIDDVKILKREISKAKLLVRVNPIYDGSTKEINEVIENGADVVMLPFFKTANEVKTFLNVVDKRAETCLLLETPEAVEEIDEILELNGIDNIHVGLNDLHLGYGLDFMFELLPNGTVDYLINKINDAKINCGFGGIANLGMGMLPAEQVIAEHYRIGSNMAILSRSFCNIKHEKNIDSIKRVFNTGISEIRNYESTLNSWSRMDFERNKRIVKEKVNLICNDIK